MDIIAIIISTLALVFSILQFLRDSVRQKKEATLIAYSELQDDVLSNLVKYPKPLPHIDYLSDEWVQMTIYLAKLERFSVGINTGIYSIRILDYLGGSFYIRQFEKLEPIIERKRKENIVPGKHYDEFEKAVNKLKKYREKPSFIKLFY